MINALIDVAEARGYRVQWHKNGPKAAWLPQLQTISLRHGMDDVQTLCSLAHELGHAHYGDPPGHSGPAERRADRFAARLLINATDYRLAEILHEGHPRLIAHELGVTSHLVRVWQEMEASRIPARGVGRRRSGRCV